MASFSPSGKSIVVTGGLSGIGLALVHHFSASATSLAPSISPSVHISILDISPPPVSERLLSSLRDQYSGVEFIFKECNVSSWDQQQKAFNEIWHAVGRIDIVFANAGISGAGKGIVQLLDIGNEGEEPQKPNLSVLDVNLTGCIYTVKLAQHYISKNSDEHEKGHIICTASSAGIYPFSVAPLYAASKHGVTGLVRSSARRLAIQKIRINGLAPDAIETSIADKKIFEGMNKTPMSSLLAAVDLLLGDQGLNGQIAEISGEIVSLREAPTFSNPRMEENFERFWGLGYA